MAAGTVGCVISRMGALIIKWLAMGHAGRADPCGAAIELFRNHKHIWTPGAGRPSARNPRIDALHSVQALACTLKTPIWAHQSCTHEPTRGRTQVVWRGATLQTLRQGTPKPSAALEASRKYAWWPHTHVHENTRLEPDAHPYARRSSHGGRRTPWTVS